MEAEFSLSEFWLCDPNVCLEPCSGHQDKVGVSWPLKMKAEKYVV